MKTISRLSSSNENIKSEILMNGLAGTPVQEIRAFAARLWKSPGVKPALCVFVISRFVLGIWLILIRMLNDDPIQPHPILRPYVGVEISQSPVLEPWQRWDTLHYQAIAERGYSAFESALFVPPLYPFLMRIASYGTGGDTLLAGIIISNIAYLLGLIVFYRYAFEEIPDQEVNKRALIYLASFPAAFFFLAAYTEALFLLFSGLTLLMALRRSWLAAGIAGGLAALTRLPGVFLLIPLAYAALIEWREMKTARSWIAPILTGIGAAVFPLYVWLIMGKAPWEPLLVQSARFNGSFTLPGMNIYHAAERIILGEAFFADWLDFGFIVLFILLAIPVWLNLTRLSSVYYLSFLILYLIREAGVQPLLGTARYVLVFFPAFIILGMIGKSKNVNRLILYSSWTLILFMAGQFAIWGWVG
jgi:hypothetical protein